MSKYQLEIYRSYFLQLKRGNYRGTFLNAKPLLLLAIFDSIPNILLENRICFSNIYFHELYKIQFKIYSQGVPTPIEKPFYHLGTEPFYDLIWKNGVDTQINTTPSAKYLRENLLYAKLDDELWDLLQVDENRQYLKNVIINSYLK